LISKYKAKPASISVSKILEISEKRIASSTGMYGVRNRTINPSLIPRPPGESIINIPKTMLSANIPGRIIINDKGAWIKEISKKKVPIPSMNQCKMCSKSRRNEL